MSTETNPRSHALSKRLQDELMALTMNPEVGVSAFPDGDTLYRWIGTIEGPVNTAYDGLKYKLTFLFPSDYPFKPPNVTFKTPCFHPNVSKTGAICLDILNTKWSAMLDVRTILISIRSLLGDPNINSPLNTSAANLWSNQKEFRKVLMEEYNRETRKAAGAN